MQRPVWTDDADGEIGPRVAGECDSGDPKPMTNAAIDDVCQGSGKLPTVQLGQTPHS
ncbi:MAG: hypothetical protein ACJAZO_004985 [Myxococcota bacterium]|jgi:hypothetical protein